MPPWNTLSKNKICAAANTAAYGLVAQLGEHTVRIRKVEGSIPFESTKKAPPFQVVLFDYHSFRGIPLASTLMLPVRI